MDMVELLQVQVMAMQFQSGTVLAQRLHRHQLLQRQLQHQCQHQLRQRQRQLRQRQLHQRQLRRLLLQLVLLVIRCSAPEVRPDVGETSAVLVALPVHQLMPRSLVALMARQRIAPGWACSCWSSLVYALAPVFQFVMTVAA